MTKLLLSLLLASFAGPALAQHSSPPASACDEIAKLAAIVMVYRQAGESPAEAAGFLNRISDPGLKAAVKGFTAEAFATPQMDGDAARQQATKAFADRARLACEAKFPAPKD